MSLDIGGSYSIGSLDQYFFGNYGKQTATDTAAPILEVEASDSSEQLPARVEELFLDDQEADSLAWHKIINNFRSRYSQSVMDLLKEEIESSSRHSLANNEVASGDNIAPTLRSASETTTATTGTVYPEEIPGTIPNRPLPGIKENTYPEKVIAAVAEQIRKNGVCPVPIARRKIRADFKALSPVNKHTVTLLVMLAARKKQNYLNEEQFDFFTEAYRNHGPYKPLSKLWPALRDKGILETNQKRPIDRGYCITAKKCGIFKL